MSICRLRLHVHSSVGPEADTSGPAEQKSPGDNSWIICTVLAPPSRNINDRNRSTKRLRFVFSPAHSPIWGRRVALLASNLRSVLYILCYTLGSIRSLGFLSSSSLIKALSAWFSFPC